VSTGVTDPVTGKKAPFSVAHISADQLPVPSTGDVLASLRGKVAGATIRVGGQPGSDLSIQLRAPTSFRGNTQPMIIVDGVIQLQDDPSLQSRGLPGSDLDINPEDIASIEVVRGAAAAALYGQRAASGVIVIKTNRGESAPQGSTRINFTSEAGVSKVARRIPLASSHRYLVDQNGQFIDLFGRPVVGRAYVLDPDQFIDNTWSVPTFDHEEQMFGTGPSLSNNLSISQSSLATNFNVQVGASNEAGILKSPQGGIERYNIRMNLDHRIGDKLALGFTTYYNRQFQRVIGDDDNPATAALNIFSRMYDIERDIDLLKRDSTGKLIPFPDDVNANRFNPIYGEADRDSWNKRAGLQAGVNATYRPISWLTLTSVLGYQRSDRNAQIQLQLPGSLNTNGSASPGEYDISADFDESYNGEVRAQVLKGFGNWTTRASVAMLGTVINQNGWVVEGDTLLQPQGDLDFARRYVADQVIRDQNTKSYNLTFGTDYKAKYIFDALYRRDGNSLLPPKTRWNSNQRLSAAWLVAEEPWWRFKSIPSFKLRYSIGTAGNNPLFEDQYETYLQNAGTERIFKQDMGNTAIIPERVTEQEFGVDMNYRNRFGLQVSLVRTYTANAIRDDTISSYTGFDTQVTNLGDHLGNTFEATLEAQWLTRRNFLWSSTLVLDRSRVKIAKYPRLCNAANNSLQRECAGYVFGQQWGTAFVRDARDLSPRHVASNSLDQFMLNDDGLLVPVGKNGHWTDGRWGTNVVVDGITYQWGMPIVMGNYDVTGLRSGNKAVNMGQSLPDAQFGLTNAVTWGPWNFHMLLSGQVGGMLYNRARERLYDIELHQDVDQAGKPSYAKKPSVYYTNNPVAASGSSGLAPGVRIDWFAEDADYVKISELQARYRFDRVPSALAATGLKQASIALTARNLFSWTKYSGQDPEAGTANVRVDDIQYPRYRTISLRTQLTF
jgi:TonB-linked SusC/RagA family outer membrane protein